MGGWVCVGVWVLFSIHEIKKFTRIQFILKFNSASFTFFFVARILKKNEMGHGGLGSNFSVL